MGTETLSTSEARSDALGAVETRLQPPNRFEKDLVCASRPGEHGIRNSADRLDRRFDLGQRFC